MNYTKNLDELLAACHEHMTQNNLAPSQLLNPNGRVQRYSSRGIKNSADEWYIIFVITHGDNTYIICIYGSWRTGEKHEFKSYESLQISEQDKQYLNEQWKQKQYETNQLLQKAKDNAAVIAKKLWNEAAQEPPSEDYLAYTILKDIRPIGARFIFFKDRPTLLLALKNIDGEIRTLQYIYKDDTGKVQKRFLLSGEKQGNFLTLGELTKESTIYVVEGWATGVSVFSATSAPVIVAYDASNIPPVVEAIRSKFPDNRIIIAGDNDPVSHTGQKYANIAAQKYNCRTVFPQFPENNNADTSGKPYTDFNDLHQRYGIDAVKKQLQEGTITPDSTTSPMPDLLQPIKENPCKDFNIDGFPPPLKNYIQKLCQETMADPIMISMSVISTISAFLGKRVCYPHYFQPLYPNIWILMITDSGNFKTTALNKGAALALKRNAAVTSCMKELEYKIKDAPNDHERSKLEREKLKMSLTNVILPTRITGEALLEHLSFGHTGIIFSSEFGGFLQNLEKKHNNDLKALFTDFYDVPQSYQYKTKTQGNLILEKPCFSICAAAASQWIKDMVNTSDIATGFFARFIIITPPDQGNTPPALPSLDLPEAHTTQEEQEIENILSSLPDTITYNPLRGDARILFEAIHERIYKSEFLHKEEVIDFLKPYHKRWSPEVLKLAMIMQVIEDPTANDIGIRAIQATISILTAAIRSTVYLFKRELGESENDRKCRILFEWISRKFHKNSRPIKRKEIFSSKQLKNGHGEYEYALQTLKEQGKIVEDNREGKGNKNDWLYQPAE